MLVDLDVKTYRNYFPNDPHPFISENFVALNSWKCEKVLRLAQDRHKTALGLIVGAIDGMLYSHFSAPFGGFHFRNELVYAGEVDEFLALLKEYIVYAGYKGVQIFLPPDLYHMTINAKTINSLIRGGYTQLLPEITSWVELENFSGEFNQKNSREYYKQAVRNGLSFELITSQEDMQSAYDIIRNNRAKFNRPIYMTLKEIMDTGDIWPVDFFKVCDRNGNMVASAIMYRNLPDICFAAFWGDNDLGRRQRAFDYLAGNLWNHYKKAGFKYIDLGISTESGHPNDGLLRFKESHNAVSSLRFKFTWHKDY